MLMEGASNKTIALELVIAEINGEGAYEGHLAKTWIAEAGGHLGEQSFE